jgi:ATP-dependent exoDNAse (exonuclease V) beta subunit
VLVHRAEPDAPIRPAEAASLREAPASLDAALRLATAPYAGPAGALPYKLTVTELAKRRWAAGDEADADADAPAVWRPEGATSEPGEQPAIRPGRLDNVQMPGAAGRGSLWHAALHWLSRNGRLRADCAEVDAQAALAAAGAALGMAAGSGTGEAARLVAEVQALLCALPLAECRLHSEVPLSAAFHAGELRSLGLEHPTLPADAAGMVVVQGTLDLLIQRPDGSALVLDFKTDRISRAEELLQRYSAQLRLYKELVRRLLPGVPVSWALYGLETVRLVGPYAE